MTGVEALEVLLVLIEVIQITYKNTFFRRKAKEFLLKFLCLNQIYIFLHTKNLASRNRCYPQVFELSFI